jgi:hypothetical protein
MQPENIRPEDLVAESLIAEGFARLEQQLVRVDASMEAGDITQARAQLRPILDSLQDVRTSHEAIMNLWHARHDRGR